MTQKTKPVRIGKRQLIILVIFAVGLYIIVPQFGNFHASLHLLGHPQASWLALAILLTFATYLTAALTYQLIAFKPLHYRELLLEQFAVMFVNRLLPSGVGAVGGNYAYFRRRRHSTAQAATMVTVNNVFGLLGHSLIVASTLAVAGTSARGLQLGHDHNAISAKLLLIVAVAVIGLLVVLRQRFIHFVGSVLRQMLSYRKRPVHFVGGLVSSMGLTLLNVLSLLACAQALGVHLAFAPILIIFTFGIGAATAAPTPGGIGGFEAGLAAGFVAYKVDSATALAVALLYRLVSYWFMLLVGGLAFALAQKRQLFL